MQSGFSLIARPSPINHQWAIYMAGECHIGQFWSFLCCILTQVWSSQVWRSAIRQAQGLQEIPDLVAIVLVANNPVHPAGSWEFFWWSAAPSNPKSQTLARILGSVFCLFSVLLFISIPWVCCCKNDQSHAGSTSAISFLFICSDLQEIYVLQLQYIWKQLQQQQQLFQLQQQQSTIIANIFSMAARPSK